ncbi:hypothetical protein CWR48_13920 [Oceanobacillus arenosus]|uniref:YopX protein domain-containing protein n=2 Tax=Oceanobacillus arenosus TaxID=1229153 RepID=A0A3D8PQT0_9BACI|nr:hypothetical protein CWR48_13920 [Oceanobacillus arenosus]
MLYCGEDIDVIFALGSPGIECTDIRNVSPDGHDVYKEHLKYMQYTGLTDKNGKEIYEGDVLQYDSPSLNHQYKHQVIFVDGRYRFSGMNDFVFNQMNLNYKRGYKVIGNIYENPELLEGESNV